MDTYPKSYWCIGGKCKICDNDNLPIRTCCVCGYSACYKHSIECHTKEFFIMGGEIDNQHKIKFKKVATFQVCHKCLGVTDVEEVGNGKYNITFSGK